VLQAGQRVLTRVVCLAKRAKQAGGRRGADQPAVLLLAKVRPCRPRALVCALDVHVVDEIPVRLLHVLEADVAQDAGIVDEDVDAPKRVNGRLDDGLALLDRVVVGDGLASSGADLVDDLVGGLHGRRQLMLCFVAWCVPAAAGAQSGQDVPLSPGPRP
jgi:hypothetical protein